MEMEIERDDSYLEEIRHRKIIRNNALIQKARYSLSLQQQKIVNYLTSMISSHDEEFKFIDFSIPDFCRLCGMDETSGKNYNDIKKAVKGIADKSVWVEMEDGTETVLRWIEKPYINRHSGTIRIKLDEDMKPYLLQQKKNFSMWEALWSYSYEYKYTERLYQYVNSVHYHKDDVYVFIATLDELRARLDADKYKTYQALKSRVLLPAVNEINAMTDKFVKMDPIKKGRAVESIRLVVMPKTQEELEMVRQRVEEKLKKQTKKNNDQVTMEDVKKTAAPAAETAEDFVEME